MILSTFTTRTGGEIMPLDVAGGSWKITLGAAGAISCDLPLGWAQAIGSDAWGETAPVKRSLLLEHDAFVVEAGPIWNRRTNRDTGMLSVSARGLRVLGEHRMVAPAVVQTINESQLFVPDPEDESGWMPNPVLATAWSGIDAGTAMQRLWLQATSWAGGDLPLVPHDERPGSSSGVIDAAAQKRLSDAIDDLEDLGPDFRLTPRRTADRTRVEWVFESGTESEPMLTGTADHVITLGLPDVRITALDIDEDAAGMASLAWASGGRSGDRALVVREASSMLTDAGYPLLERFNTEHASEDNVSVLRRHARYDLALGSAASQSWRFELPIDQVPALGDFREGHFLRIVTDGLPATVERHAFPLPRGEYRMRILEVSGGFDSPSCAVTCAPGRRVA